MKICIYKNHVQSSKPTRGSNYSVDYIKNQSFIVIPEIYQTELNDTTMGIVNPGILNSDEIIENPKKRNFSAISRGKSLIEIEHRRKVNTQLKIFENERKRVRMLSSKIDKSLERFKSLNFFSNKGISSIINNKLLSRNVLKDAKSLVIQTKSIPMKSLLQIEGRSKKYSNKKLVSGQVNERKIEKGDSPVKNMKAKSSLFVSPSKNLKKEKIKMYQVINGKRPCEEKIVPTEKKKIRDWKTENLSYSINDKKLLTRKKVSLMKYEEKFRDDKYPFVAIKNIISTKI
jgi:hypothetical protein